VKQEAEKRRKANKERDEWKGKAEQLSAQLQAIPAAGPPATMQDPLADVVDSAGLARAKKQFKEMLRFAEENPDGADDVLIGTDEKGREVRMDYSRKDIVEMKLTAQEVLQEGIPARRSYLNQVGGHIETAKEIYPDLLAQEANEVNTMADEILRAVPEIKRSPEWILWLGDAVAGRRARLAKANGAPTRSPSGKPLTKSQAALVNAPKVPIAPSVAKSRAVGSGVAPATRVVEELEKAKKAHIESGFSSETLERLITLKRQAQTRPTGGKTPALV
jgi:hypothetical protein